MSKSTLQHDFPASVVVFLVALPLCMGVAIASGVPVAAGLITGIVGGLVVGMLAGSPLQVSGPAAGLTVIIADVVLRFGLETLGIIVLLAGGIQVVAGMLRLGQWFRAVSPAVIKGMLAGIGVLIFASQFHVMVDDTPKGSGIENLITIPQAIVKGLAIPENGGRDSRQFHKEMLQQVGELHRRQVNLEERIGEIFPHVHNPELEYTDVHRDLAATSVPGFAEEQQQIEADLSAVVADLRKVERLVASEERAERVEKVAELALREGQAALETLQAVNGPQIIAAQDKAAASLQGLLDQLKNHHIAAHLGILSIAVIVLWQFAPTKLKVIPAPLVAVTVATIGAAIVVLPVLFVEVPDRLWDGIHFPSIAVLQDAQLSAFIQAAVVIAIVASAETLLCATAVDQLHDGPRTDYDRELFAQGVGNMFCGILGALPMTGVIVRSSANVGAGAKTRLSAILHGVWLLLFVVALGFMLRQIPTACLAAILVYTGYKLVDFKAVRALSKYGKSEVAIYAATVTMIVVTDLLTGVLTGIGLAAVKLLYTFSHLEINMTIDEEKNSAVMVMRGAATFMRLPVVASELERVPRGSELRVDFQHLDYIDHACLELMMNWAKQHEKTDGRLTIDWKSLHARFHSGGKRGGDAPEPDAG